MQNPQRLTVMTQFARMWSGNMNQLIHPDSQWPGFRYTPEEKQRMAGISATVRLDILYIFMWINAVISIALFVPFVLIMFAGLTAVSPDPSKLPAVVFFVALALTCATAIGIGVPSGMWITCWLTARFQHPDPATIPDEQFGRRLFAKVSFQVVRMAVVMSLVMIPLWLFVPSDGKIVMFLRVIVPMLSPLVIILTAASAYLSRSKNTQVGVSQ